MSEVETAKVGGVMMPVQGTFSQVNSSPQIDAIGLTVKMVEPTEESLKLITRLPDAMAMTLVDTLEHCAKEDGLLGLKSMIHAFSSSLRKNYCAEGGWRSTQVKDMVIADMQKAKDDGEGVKGQLFKER